jgi:hypothetical protein
MARSLRTTEEQLIELVRQATPEDARDIASRIRPADRREALAFVGVSPSILLPLAAAKGTALVGTNLDGRPEVIFGVDPVVGTPNVGMVWLMATTALDTDNITKFLFARNSKKVLRAINEKHPILGAYVDERNEVHLQWLEWLGFQTLKRIPEWGAAKVPFRQVIKIRED